MRSGDWTQSTNDDCILPPDDPIHAFKIASAAGISIEAALARQKVAADERAWHERQTSPEMEYAKKYGVRPGTPAWNALWGNK